MQLRIKINFNFHKLLKNKRLPKDIHKMFKKHNEVFVKLTKRGIQGGFDGKKTLSPKTIESRQAGSRRFGEASPPAPTTSTQPLIHTGALLNSVKEVKKGGNPAMEIKEYGFLQQSGFTAGGRYAGATVPPRRFMPLTAASKKGKVHADQRMRKAMSKHEGRLIKRWKSVIRTPWKTISK